MKEEPRYLQAEYEKQADNTLYNQSLDKSAETRQDYEKSHNLQKRTAKSGTSGRRQTGVQVLSGNASAVFSDTRADGARDNNRPAGIATVNKEASKIGAPIANDDIEFLGNQAISPGDRGSEM